MDGLGSVRLLVDTATRQIVDTSRYAPFGSLLAGGVSDNNRRFTGDRCDAPRRCVAPERHPGPRRPDQRPGAGLRVGRIGFRAPAGGHRHAAGTGHLPLRPLRQPAGRRSERQQPPLHRG
ncbi:MAG: hypothetical protein QHJ74_09700 [Anaerolineae bacterium]|nr:hypothetical protein [Anaerolineae bacterium]